MPGLTDSMSFSQVLKDGPSFIYANAVTVDNIYFVENARTIVNVCILIVDESRVGALPPFHRGVDETTTLPAEVVPADTVLAIKLDVYKILIVNVAKCSLFVSEVGRPVKWTVKFADGWVPLI
jgi:hypothetical protein